MTNRNPLEQLSIADPETHAWVAAHLERIIPAPSDDLLALLVDNTIQALAQESAFGKAMALGLLSLVENKCENCITVYLDIIWQAARTGVTLGRILATHLYPVLTADETLLNSFLNATTIMQRKGTYTLNAPLEVSSELLTAGERDSASAYIDLLAAAFVQEMTYNQSLRLVYTLPKAVRSFAPARRRSQIVQLRRVLETDFELVDAFLDGMERGLALLSGDALEHFVDIALERYGRSADSGTKFLSLTSKIGQDTCAGLQVAAPLNKVKSQLGRYLTARLGRVIPLKSLSALPAGLKPDPWVCCDGDGIFLPDEIEHFDSLADNLALYKTLTRLEAGYLENNTFSFDLERAADLYPVVAKRLEGQPAVPLLAAGCDAQRFFMLFERQQLAEDLFNLFEQARVCQGMSRAYPGLMRTVRPVLQTEYVRLSAESRWMRPLTPLYAHLVLGVAGNVRAAPDMEAVFAAATTLFEERIGDASPVEAVAELVCMVYDMVRPLLPAEGNHHAALSTPFQRRLRWDLVCGRNVRESQLADRVKMHLQKHRLKVYRSDLRQLFASQSNGVSPEEIKALVVNRPDGHSADSVAVDWNRVNLEALLEAEGCTCIDAGANGDAACRYPEWDCHLQDYLHAHTRVQEVSLSGGGNGEFYNRTLSRYRGLLTHTRRAFELLRPEGLALLRQWPEGDSFDYRALLDFAIERRAGRIPSDRLFIKRLKQERDVAVLLLVDLSRSTANAVRDGHSTVLDVAKEALVLFCEALQVVGDTYAIAGFSGTGRHSVDYFCIKDFQERMGPDIQQRISALTPQRSTRMGAAIRHASARLNETQSGVRLLIIVSDGFPNDLGYKADYAIADTRRAIQEARSGRQHVKAITVNIGSDPRLEELYGRFHYHVIQDVRELPDTLIRMYGTLTR